MKNYQKLIINIGIQKIIFLLSLVFCSLATAENFPPKHQEPIISSEQNLSSVRPSFHARAISQSQIIQMMDELQQLVNRVESTLISVEAKQNSSNSRMSDAVANLSKNNNRATFVSINSPNNSQNNYRNTRANRSIVNAKELLKQFPYLVRQDFSRARRMWLDARRDLWMSYPTDRNFAQPEIRAMWLDRGTIVKAKSKKDLEPLFDSMARAGINTVFMETINASYPIYPSRVAPEQNPMTRGWDPLKASIELAHERGMELHAWLWAFAAANQGHNAILGKPKNYLGPVLSRHPSWVLKDQNGRVFNRTPGFKKAFFDPANPQVRRYLLALIDEIVTKYDVDGIQLDYIRYPFQDNTTRQQFGYTNVSRSLFKQRYGIDPRKISRSSYAWQKWIGFKIQQVSSFVEEASRLIKNKRPEVILSTAVFPMERQKRLMTLQQHWEDWSYRQSVDMVVLMTYALDTGSFEDRLRLVYDAAGKNSNFIIPAIRLLNVPETEAFDQVQLIRNMPSGGYALFAAENFNTSLETIFKQTQGNTTESQEPIPYRQPFATALSRYRALKQEWIFLLQNDQIKIDQGYLQQWSGQSDRLAEVLQTLAENPSVDNAVNAQRQLSSFRLRLSRYLSRHKQANSWQVESWMNRLITVENIVKYGQTMVANQNSNNNTSAFQPSKN
jgi:uncharacterized lipoprotein YddW (UPF0748 family)